MNDEFDGWIERELHAAFAGLGDSIPEPAYRTAPRRGLRLRNLVPAVIGGKLAAGVAITCMAAASSVAASAVVTGSPDPFTLIHRSPAPAAAPDTTAHPAAPGESGSPASNAGSNGVQHGDSGGRDTGTAQGSGGRSSGGSDAGGNAGATAPGQSDASHGAAGAGTGNGVATGGGREHSGDASSLHDRHRES